MVTTLAGLAGSAGSADGTESAARFYCSLRRGGGQRGQRLCGGHIQRHDPESDAGGTNWVVTTLAGLAGSDWQRGRDGERRAV